MRHLQDTVTGISSLSGTVHTREACETCTLTKSARIINREPQTQATRRLERVYTDICGPFQQLTLNGERYILTFIDEYSRKSWIYLTKTRTELYTIAAEWQKEVERQSNEELLAVRSDNAREYHALAKRLWKQSGVRSEFTTPYTPEQNGVAERLNRTLTSRIRAMLLGAGLPTKLWGEAAHTANYIYNRTPRQYDGHHYTPEEIWTGTKPDLEHLRVFGCVAYAQLAQEQRKKLDDTSIQGIFVGYTPTYRQYRVYDPVKNVVGRYSTVRFDETTMGGVIYSQDQGSIDELAITIRSQDIEDYRISQNVANGREGSHQSDMSISDTIIVGGQRGQAQDQAAAQPEEPLQGAGETHTEHQDRRGRTIRLPERYRASQVSQDVATPVNYDDAISGPQKKQWETAINNELQSLASNDVWTLAPAPKGANIVSCKWVFKVKRLPNGQIDRYKARLVARGFSQQYGIDYEETFAPVVRMESLHVLLAIAAAEDIEIHQMDVVTAYLAEELEEEIWMEPPPETPYTQGIACKLKKGLYGLKQSARVWNQRFTAELRRIELRLITADQSIWIKEEYQLILALYVDDIVLIAQDTHELRKLKADLARVFNMKDLGEIQNVLGLRIRRDRVSRRLWID